jgi:hypothetical protein
MLNVVQLQKQTDSAVRVKRSAKRKGKALTRQAATACGIGLVVMTLTALSLSHLAHGIEIVTASPGWQSWAMAIGVDLGFVALELAMVMASDKLRKQVARLANPAIIGTLSGSAALNAFAFVAGASGIGQQIAAVTMGVAIPGLIYALTKVGAAIYLDCSK